MKNFILIILLIFVYSCGYTSVLKNQQKDLKITIKNIEGDLQTNNFIKNELKLISSPNSTKNYNINIKSKYDKKIIAKDSTGSATDYKINIALEFTILSKNNKKIDFNEELNVKKDLNSFEEFNYEREIKRNFASSTKNKLIIYLISLDDN